MTRSTIATSDGSVRPMREEENDVACSWVWFPGVLASRVARLLVRVDVPNDVVW